jgi:hypothetical protein
MIGVQREPWRCHAPSLLVRVLPLILGLAVVTGGTRALAHRVNDGISAREKALAKKAYQQAVRLYQAGKYNEALTELRKAYDYAPLPSILYDLGVTYLKVGNASAARAALSEYLNALPKGPHSEQAAKLLQELRAQKGAEVAKAEAEAQPSQTLAGAAPEDAAPETASPEKEATPSPPQTSSAEPNGEDNENPLLSLPRPAAPTQEPALVPSETTDRGSSRFRVWKWSTAGATLAAATVGVLMLARASDQDDALQSAAAQGSGTPRTRYTADIRALEDGYSTNRAWGTIALVGAGALAVTTVTLFVLDHRPQSRARARDCAR